MTQKPPIYLIATLIVGGGLNILAQALGTALPGYATLILNVTGIVVAIAGLIVTYYQAVNAPAKALVVDPATGSVPVITPAGQTNATVVTTTSTEPTTAPLASAAQVPLPKGP